MVNLVNNISFIFAYFSGKMRSLIILIRYECVCMFCFVCISLNESENVCFTFIVLSHENGGTKRTIPHRHSQQQEKDAHTLFSKSSGFIPIKWYVFICTYEYYCKWNVLHSQSKCVPCQSWRTLESTFYGPMGGELSLHSSHLVFIFFLQND